MAWNKEIDTRRAQGIPFKREGPTRECGPPKERSKKVIYYYPNFKRLSSTFSTTDIAVLSMKHRHPEIKQVDIVKALGKTKETIRFSLRKIAAIAIPEEYTRFYLRISKGICQQYGIVTAVLTAYMKFKPEQSKTVREISKQIYIPVQTVRKYYYIAQRGAVVIDINAISKRVREKQKLKASLPESPTINNIGTLFMSISADHGHRTAYPTKKALYITASIGKKLLKNNLRLADFIDFAISNWTFLAQSYNLRRTPALEDIVKIHIDIEMRMLQQIEVSTGAINVDDLWEKGECRG